MATVEEWRGDIRFVKALTPNRFEPRLALVRGVDRVRGYAEILMVHAYPEMACEVDVVIDRAVSGASFNVVVETDLRGIVWTYQLGSVVGRLEEDDFREANRVVSERDVEGSGIRCGLRLAGVVDPRWEFKSDEGEVLRLLAADCTEYQLSREDW